MICVVIRGPDFNSIVEQIKKSFEAADILEFRIDLFNFFDIQKIADLKSIAKVPVIFTLRSSLYSGEFKGNEINRLSCIKELATLEPEYFDLETDLLFDFYEEITLKHPSIQLISSIHDFNKMGDLSLLDDLFKNNIAPLYKIALTALSTHEALKLLLWIQKASTIKPVMGLSMGKFGQVTRILGPVFGSFLSYACLDVDSSTEPYQIDAFRLKNLFRYHNINKETKIFGLIGDPVDKSISEETHNILLKELGVNAVYVKLLVKIDELKEFFEVARKFPFSGLSVTMPLKKAVMPFIDTIKNGEDIWAINTLSFDNGEITGSNTDGLGALKAIEKYFSIKNKKVLIIGAGGSAEAIGFEIIRAGGQLTLVNRDFEKGKKLAKQLKCRALPLAGLNSTFNEPYDLLINCTPLEMPIDVSFIIPYSCVMDINTRKEDSLLLKMAKEKKCFIIQGSEMFIEQALLQWDLWFKGSLNPIKTRDILTKALFNLK